MWQKILKNIGKNFLKVHLLYLHKYYCVVVFPLRLWHICVSLPPFLLLVSLSPLCVSPHPMHFSSPNSFLHPPVCAFRWAPLCVSSVPPWDTGTMGNQDKRTQGHQNIGTLEHWDSGEMGHQNTGTMGHLDNGTQGQWMGVGCLPAKSVLWFFNPLQ